jgi:hypothetical protein
MTFAALDRRAIVYRIVSVLPPHGRTCRPPNPTDQFPASRHSRARG